MAYALCDYYGGGGAEASVLSVPDSTPGAGGAALVADLKILADRIGPCKYDATAAPTADDDEDDGYRVGSRWFNHTTQDEYVCLDATATAAVWVPTSLAPGSVGTSDLADLAVTAAKLAAGAVTAAKLGYAPDSMVMVQRGATDLLSGTNLKAAYVAACALTPGGEALSSLNRACVLFVGRYKFTSLLDLSAEFVDLMGLGTAAEIYAELETAVVQQTADDVRLRNFTIRSLGYSMEERPKDFEVDATDNSDSIYEDMHFYKDGLGWSAYGTSNLGGTWWRCKTGSLGFRVAANKELSATMYDCEAAADSFGGDETGADITGRLERCRAGGNSFGGCVSFGCNVSGTLIECVAGNSSFALGRNFSGTAIRCRGGKLCFGSTYTASHPGEFSGHAEDCVAEDSSFGGRKVGIGAYGKCTGTLVRCRSVGSPLAIRFQGTMIDCDIEVTAAGEDAVELLANLLGSGAETADASSTTTVINIVDKDVTGNFPVGSFVKHAGQGTWHRITASVFSDPDTDLTVSPAAGADWDAEDVRAQTAPRIINCRLIATAEAIDADAETPCLVDGVISNKDWDSVNCVNMIAAAANRFDEEHLAALYI